MNLIVEVDRSFPFQSSPVVRPCCAKTLDITVVSILRIARVNQAKTDQAQSLNPRCDRIAVAAPRKRHQVADNASYIDFVDGVPSHWLFCEWCCTVDNRKGERVKCSHLESRQVRRSLKHLFLSALVERHKADGASRQVPDSEQVARSFGQHTRLARPGWGDDSCRTSRVGDRFELIWSQIGIRDVRCRRNE